MNECTQLWPHNQPHWLIVARFASQRMGAPFGRDARARRCPVCCAEPSNLDWHRGRPRSRYRRDGPAKDVGSAALTGPALALEYDDFIGGERVALNFLQTPGGYAPIAAGVVTVEPFGRGRGSMIVRWRDKGSSNRISQSDPALEGPNMGPRGADDSPRQSVAAACVGKSGTAEFTMRSCNTG